MSQITLHTMENTIQNLIGYVYKPTSSSPWLTPTNEKTEFYKKFIQDPRDTQLEDIRNNEKFVTEELIAVIEQEWKTPTTDQKIVISQFYYSIASNHNHSNYFNKSLELCLQVESQMTLQGKFDGIIYILLGTMYLKEEWKEYNYDTSIDYFKKSIDLGHNLGCCCFTVGLIYLEKKVYIQALDYFIKGYQSGSNYGLECFEQIVKVPNDIKIAYSLVKSTPLLLSDTDKN